MTLGCAGLRRALDAKVAGRFPGRAAARQTRTRGHLTGIFGEIPIGGRNTPFT